jgi:hypothetical protein
MNIAARHARRSKPPDVPYLPYLFVPRAHTCEGAGAGGRAHVRARENLEVWKVWKVGREGEEGRQTAQAGGSE